MRTVLSDPDRTDDFRAAAATSSTWRPPTSTPASGSCSAPRAGTTSRSPPPCAPRRRCRWSTSPTAVKDRELVDGGDRLDHQPRHRGRGGREVHRRRQPARAVRQRLLEGDPDAVRHARAPGLGHGLPEDRLPDVQAARLPAPARDGAPVGGALPGRRHRPDRARARRRADVPDEHPQLRLAASRSPATASSPSPSSSPRTTTTCARSASATASRSPPRACARSSRHFSAEKEKTRAWRRILEQTTGTLLRQSAGD